MDQREHVQPRTDDPVTETTVEEYLGPLAEEVELEGGGTVQEPVSTLVGFNVAPYFEPTDQAAMMVGARRLQQFNEDYFGDGGIQVPVVCGAFRALNQETPEAAREWTAEGTFRAGVNAARYEEMADTMGLTLPSDGVVTDADILGQQQFWDQMYRQARDGEYASFDEIRRRTTEHHVPAEHLGEKITVDALGTVFDDRFDVDTRLDNMAEAHDAGGEMRGPELYTLLESAVFEAAADMISDQDGKRVNGKLGPSKEQLYDDLMDLHSVRVAQPAGFDWEAVDPYIAWDDDRVFFIDSRDRM
ncbi:MAG: hypothetical protein SVU88_01610, partial [Candidatus Nanohaloarchaea archaeon]|nr:hypothetical protein [Candidatus Nanohaloarchaea archaeon]